MKIAIIGYGKMGKMIEEVALERGHEIVLKINSSNLHLLTSENLQKADVAIEFTQPDAALKNIMLCFDADTPVVVGTTAWQNHLEEVTKKCKEKNGALVYASNFSVGVNMLFALNETLSKWMSRFPEYAVSMEEIHHTQKLDAPSGTAITLAEGILKNIKRFSSWLTLKKGENHPVNADQLPIYYERKDNVPGIHKLHYTSSIDHLQISHEAFNRKGFALGSILAAEFIQSKKGIFTAKEIFKFES